MPGGEEYIEGLNRFLDMPEWDRLYDDALGQNIPVIRKNTAKLLYIILKLAAPKRVLEIGTGSGYSALWIRKAIPESSELITLERDKNRFDAAEKLFAGSKHTKVLYRDAFDHLPSETGTYDAVFLDSQKRDYIALVPLIEKKLTAGGILFADNILFGGRVVQLAPEDEDKYKSGSELLRQFNESLAGGGPFESLFLPIDDGVVIARKI